MLVIHQRLDLAGFNADTGQAVVAVKFQVDGFTSSQCCGAHLGNDGALVAHFGGQQGNVATQSGFELAFIDDAAGAAVAFVAVFASHEVSIADAMGGGHQAAHIHTRVLTEIHTRGIAQHHLAVGRDAAKIWLGSELITRLSVTLAALGC